MKFTGHDGEIEFEENVIKIKKGKKDSGRTIPISQIVSTSLKKPSLTYSGCIHIQVLGAKTYPAYAATMDYANDMNAIFFRKSQYEEAIKFKDELDDFIKRSGTISVNTESESAPSYDFDKLRELKSLLDDGIISQNEFDKAKSKILGI